MVLLNGFVGCWWVRVGPGMWPANWVTLARVSRFRAFSLGGASDRSGPAFGRRPAQRPWAAQLAQTWLKTILEPCFECDPGGWWPRRPKSGSEGQNRYLTEGFIPLTTEDDSGRRPRPPEEGPVHWIFFADCDHFRLWSIYRLERTATHKRLHETSEVTDKYGLHDCHKQQWVIWR